MVESLGDVGQSSVMTKAMLDVVDLTRSGLQRRDLMPHLNRAFCKKFVKRAGSDRRLFWRQYSLTPE